MVDKYQIVQKGERSWQLCRFEFHRHVDMDVLVAKPFGTTYHRFSAAIAELRNMRENNYLDEVPK